MHLDKGFLAGMRLRVMDYWCCGCQVLGLPANRLQLSREGVGFLRDQFSLAFSNVAGDVTLQLSIRERGGRKK